MGIARWTFTPAVPLVSGVSSAAPIVNDDPDLDIGAQVQRQYEALPYPPRDPAEERQRLIITYTEPLDKIAHYCYAGQPRFDDNFRALVAGGGTGDSLIYLARQLQHTAARITYIDLSAASLQIAQARAKVRGLNNIDWLSGSLLDLPALLAQGKLDIGAGRDGFDYINCSGVLHHLPDPGAGLRALNEVMDADGGMGLMLYGHYGRANIYPIQALLAPLRQPGDSFASEIEFAVDVLEGLPKRHPFRLELPSWSDDIETYGAAGLYDLLLHCQDRAYTVPELYEFLELENLHLVEFAGSGLEAPYGYTPESFLQLTDARLKERLAVLPRRQRQAIAETACMQQRRHSFYVSRRPAAEAMAQAHLSSVLVWHPALCFDPAQVAAALRDGNELDISDGAGNLHLAPEPLFAELMSGIDGTKSLEEIASGISGSTGAELLTAARSMLVHFSSFGWLFIRNPMGIRD